jgi:hypothetical protein
MVDHPMASWREDAADDSRAEVAANSAEQIYTLTQELKAANEELEAVRKRFHEARSAQNATETSYKEVMGQFNDLKVRLQAAETANQFMRGYLARVQEDDVVREELVTTGDPTGESVLTPKRKPTVFPTPEQFTFPAARQEDFGYAAGFNAPRHKPKHWITY